MERIVGGKSSLANFFLEFNRGWDRHGCFKTSMSGSAPNAYQAAVDGSPADVQAQQWMIQAKNWAEDLEMELAKSSRRPSLSKGRHWSLSPLLRHGPHIDVHLHRPRSRRFGRRGPRPGGSRSRSIKSWVVAQTSHDSSQSRRGPPRRRKAGAVAEAKLERKNSKPPPTPTELGLPALSAMFRGRG